MLLDCHTHRQAPYPQGIINASSVDAEMLPGQLYSVGLHPWSLPEELSPTLKLLADRVVLPQVAAVGEAGLDTLCKTPMWLQLTAFRQQAEIAEMVGKPLIVHCVRSAQEICQLRRQMCAATPWIIHGFRGKPSLLKMLLEVGCYISYSDRFNTESLRATPTHRLLAETDDSPVSIECVLDSISHGRGEDIKLTIIDNMNKLFIR